MNAVSILVKAPGELAPAAAHCHAVTRCRIAQAILNEAVPQLSSEALQCAPVVLSQFLDRKAPAAEAGAVSENVNRWLIPEPWNGHIESAKLLFIGQNPSVNFQEDYLSLADLAGDASQERVFAFFENRFSTHIKDGTKVKRKDELGGFGPSNRFLSFVQKMARRLYGRSDAEGVRPGIDYALTEAVRCKSREAIGVHLATGVCAANHLVHTLELSPAKVVVCVGAAARKAVVIASSLPLSQPWDHKDSDSEISRSYPFDGYHERDGRLFLFTRHSSAWGGDAFPLPSDLIARIRPLLV
jgi:hypothetical protein